MTKNIQNETLIFRQDLKNKTTTILTGDDLEKMNMAKKRKGEKFDKNIGYIVALLKYCMVKENTIDSIVELLRNDLK